MKRIYLFLLLSFAVFAQTNLVRVPASTVGGSGAKCQLRGVAGTRTAAIDSINGVYNNPYFEFTVTTSGRYDLYYDSNGTTGGLSYSKQTDWSGTYGRWIDGMIDAERALTLQETADTDNDGKVETAGLEDSLLTLTKINATVYKYIGYDTTITFYIGSVDTVDIDISGWGLSAPVAAQMTEYTNYFGAVVKSLTSSNLVLRAKDYGFDIVYEDSAKITIGVNDR